MFSPQLWLNCSECGKGFLRRQSVQKVRRKHPNSTGELQFCTKQCNGRWVGKNHGFGRKETA